MSYAKERYVVLYEGDSTINASAPLGRRPGKRSALKTAEPVGEARELLATPYKLMTKAALGGRKSFIERVMMPATFEGSQKQYVDSLEDSDSVKLSPPASSHGLPARPVIEVN